MHYGPRTSGPGCRLGGAEKVIRQYGPWPPGLAGRLGGRGRLRRSRSPRRQLEKLQLGGPQDLAASPRGVAHVVCRARSRYITCSGPSGSAADLGDRASSGASGARDASEETPAWRATWASLRAHGAARTSCAQDGRSALRAADLRARLPTWKGRGCRQTILAVAARASRPTGGAGPAPAQPEPETPA
jgi:hypothetical protein